MTIAERAAKIYLPASRTSERFGDARGMWYDTFQCGGKTADGHVAYVGANLGYIGDFCGGRVVGCVNPATQAWHHSFEGTALDKEMPPVPDDILAVWRKHVGNSASMEKYVWPTVGLMAHLIGHTHIETGAAQMFAWDRTNGTTYKLLSAGAAILCGLPIRHASTHRVGKLKAWERSRPYINLNSGHRVGQLTFKFQNYGNPSHTKVQPFMAPAPGTTPRVPFSTPLWYPY